MLLSFSGRSVGNDAAEHTGRRVMLSPDFSLHMLEDQMGREKREGEQSSYLFNDFSL